MKRQPLAVLVLIGMACMIFLMFFIYFERKGERTAELADLMGMYDAEMTARITWKDETPKHPEEYWYDVDHFALIPTDEPKPAPYGRGSSVCGCGVKDFATQNDKYYDYDERTDYRDKVIHLEVSDEGGVLDVRVDWVHAD